MAYTRWFFGISGILVSTIAAWYLMPQQDRLYPLNSRPGDAPLSSTVPVDKTSSIPVEPLQTHRSQKDRTAGQAQQQLDTLKSNKTPHAQSSLPLSEGLMTEQEIAVFQAEVADVFLELVPATVHLNDINQQLSDLNRRGLVGAKAIATKLQEPPNPESTENIRQRIANIDYLKYRMGFDPDTRNLVQTLIHQPVDPLPVPQRAVVMAEIAELIGGLAPHAWHAAAASIESVTNETLKRIALYEAYHAIAAKTDKDHALQLVRSIAPDFSPT